MRTALIDQSNNLVVNAIELDPQAIWEAPANHIVVASEIASIGWLYVDGEFIAPEPPAQEGE